jgi:hypothetical protein
MFGQNIISVVETGGDDEATDTIQAKWTGQTFPVTINNEPAPGLVVGDNYTVGTFGHQAPAFVDRNHRYSNHFEASGTPPDFTIPAYLVGADYIMSGNDNRDNGGYVLDITIANPSTVYMLIDNRLGGNNLDPPTFGPTAMQWILDENWEPTANGLNRNGDMNVPDEVPIDEGADNTINQWYSVYKKDFPAGMIQLLQADNAGQNMYGVVIKSLAVGPVISTWNVDANGNWSAATSWAGGVPNAAGATAVLGGIITQPRTVTVDVPITVGRIDFDDTNAYTVAGSNALTLDATSGSAQINVINGSHTISAPITLADDATITVTPAASNLTLSGALTATGRNLAKAGAGTLTASNVRAAGLAINGGSVAIAPNGGNAGTSLVSSLTIAGATDAWTGTLNLNNNDAIVNSTAATKAADLGRLNNQLKQGFNNGTWTGQGITSSTAAGNTAADTGLTVVDNALLGLSNFSGQSVTANSILLKYTYYGDIDQNGQVDADDLTVFASNFGRAAGATQIDGDIDFNGAVNADDLTVFANNFNKGVGSPLATASVQAVPEPQTIGLVIAGLAALVPCILRRRRG